jgi:hypothetical protein
MPVDNFSLISDRQHFALEKARELRLEEHTRAAAGGELWLERQNAPQPWRALSDDTCRTFLGLLIARQDRPGDGGQLAGWSEAGREVARATVEHNQAMFDRNMRGQGPPGQTRFLERPGLLVGPARGHHGNAEPIFLCCQSGELFTLGNKPSEAPEWLPLAQHPCYLELPGLWPDGGAADRFPVDQAWAELRTVRWAPGRKAFFLAPGAPEPSDD